MFDWLSMKAVTCPFEFIRWLICPPEGMSSEYNAWNYVRDYAFYVIFCLSFVFCIYKLGLFHLMFGIFLDAAEGVFEGMLPDKRRKRKRLSEVELFEQREKLLRRVRGESPSPTRSTSESDESCVM